MRNKGRWRAAHPALGQNGGSRGSGGGKGKCLLQDTSWLSHKCWLIAHRALTTCVVAIWSTRKKRAWSKKVPILGNKLLSSSAGWTAPWAEQPKMANRSPDNFASNTTFQDRSQWPGPLLWAPCTSTGNTASPQPPSSLSPRAAWGEVPVQC